MLRKYFKNAGIIAITETVLSFKSILIIPFLTRHLGALNYGVWSQISTVVAILSPFIILGSHHGIIRYLPGKPKEERRNQFVAWLLFLVLMCVLIFLVVILAREELADVVFGGGDEFNLFLPLAAISLATDILLNAFRNWYRVENNAKIYSYINLGVSFLSAAAVAAILIRDETVFQLIVYSVGADFLVIGILVTHFLLSTGMPKPDFSIIRPVVKFGLPLMPAGWALLALNYVDRIFLVNYFDLRTIGVYGLAYSVGTLIVPFMLKPFRMMFPNSAAELFNQNDLKTLQRLYDRSAGTSLLLAIPTAVGLFVLGKPLLTVFATAEFAAGGPAIAFISAGYIFLILSDYFMVSLGLVHKQHYTTISYYVALAIHILLNFLLIPRFAITGAAVSTLLSFLALLVMCFVFANRYQVFKTNFAFIAKVIVSSSIMGAVAYLFNTMVIRELGNPLAELVLVSVLGIAVYLVCLQAFGLLTKEKVILLINALRRKNS